MGRERLAKVMARAGIASRRQCEALIFAGRVRVDGQTITHPAIRVDATAERVEVDGKVVSVDEPKRYAIVYKPRGTVSTSRDPRGRRTVVELIPQRWGRLFPVGRLDMNSEGMMILTNDGELALLATHPRYEVAKEYLVTVRGHPSLEALDRIRTGIDLDDGRTAAAEVEVISVKEDRSVLMLIIREGRKRQIRRMMEAVGHPALRLKRVAIGPVRMGPLRPGKFRLMTDDEVKALRKAGQRGGHR